MTFFWGGDKYIPFDIGDLIVEFTASEINIAHFEFVVGRFFKLRQYIGYWSSDRMTFTVLYP